jgi:hypothetical protein
LRRIGADAIVGFLRFAEQRDDRRAVGGFKMQELIVRQRMNDRVLFSLRGGAGEDDGFLQQ